MGRLRPTWPGIQLPVRAQATPVIAGPGWVSGCAGGGVLGFASSRALPIPPCPAPVALSMGLVRIKEGGARIFVCARVM